MKLLFVAIPNHHFFQWINQMKDAGHEVYWFDITDGSDFVSKISWVHQIRGWKRRFDFPFRHRIKKKFPKAHFFIQKLNERSAEKEFEKVVVNIKPDVIHCFEMKLSGIPIFEVMKKYHEIPFIYSSWGSDLYAYKKLGVKSDEVKNFLKRVDYLLTDCHRDFNIATSHGFLKKYLGIWPGNGGILIPTQAIKDQDEREIIMIKGYEDQFGKALKIIEAFEKLSVEQLKRFRFIIYSTDKSVYEKIENSDVFKKLNYQVFQRGEFIENQTLLEFMGNSVLHIANSTSDGMPNALLEAMGMGAFPIQSNPGGATEEILTHGKNGFLIDNPFDSDEIKEHIIGALQSNLLRKNAQDYNTLLISKNYDRRILGKKIANIYSEILRDK